MNNNVLLQIRSVAKKFPGVRALDGVSLDIRAGQVMGLLGINGAGKSTLMNVLSGIIQPDEGELVVDGKSVVFKDPSMAQKYGIALIHQEALMFSELTVAENIFVTRLSEYKKAGRMNYKKLYADAAKQLEIVGSSINPKALIREITIGDMQMVEIARAICQGASIILLDEPTSSLTIKEKQRLFEIIDGLKKGGKALIYITHFIDEVFEVCDDITVMRDGKISGCGRADELDRSDIIRMMIGFNLKKINVDRDEARGETVLDVRRLSRGSLVKEVHFDLKKGEILGIWGLLGAGRTELIRAMFGLDRPDAAEIYFNVNGQMQGIKGRQLLAKCGYVTENRHFDGLFMSMELWKNMTMPNMEDYFTKVRYMMDVKKEKREAEGMKEKLSIAAASVQTKAEHLSGGNQQKVIFGRWFMKNREVFVLDEPTRGVDVGAKAEIHNNIIDMAKRGNSVLLISSEIEEIINLSTRVLIMKKGEIKAEVSGKEISKEKLLDLC